MNMKKRTTYPLGASSFAFDGAQNAHLLSSVPGRQARERGSLAILRPFLAAP